jgi:hypothetical protein
MAKIKFGDNVVAMSGKRGGNIYSRNKGGAYSKNWVKPTNPFSTFKAAVKSVFGALSQSWRTLTDAQRLAWNSTTANYQVTDRLGSLITLSGIALYKGLNQNLDTVGVAALTSPVMPQGVLISLFNSLTADVSDAALHVIMDGVVPAGMAQVIEATPPLSAGVYNASNKFRIITTVAAAGAADQDIAGLYIARFGSFPPAGSKIFARVKYINVTSGESSTYGAGSCIVTA